MYCTGKVLLHTLEPKSAESWLNLSGGKKAFRTAKDTLNMAADVLLNQSSKFCLTLTTKGSPSLPSNLSILV
jgi:hypothetical protein